MSLSLQVPVRGLYYGFKTCYEDLKQRVCLSTIDSPEKLEPVWKRFLERVCDKRYKIKGKEVIPGKFDYLIEWALNAGLISEINPNDSDDDIHPLSPPPQYGLHLRSFKTLNSGFCDSKTFYVYHCFPAYHHEIDMEDVDEHFYDQLVKYLNETAPPDTNPLVYVTNDNGFIGYKVKTSMNGLQSFRGSDHWIHILKLDSSMLHLYTKAELEDTKDPDDIDNDDSECD